MQARRLATLELNALVEGAIEGGATEIVAWVGHCNFPGCIDVELLHPECKLEMNTGDAGPVCLDDTYDAIFLTGLHAKQDTQNGVLAHGLFPGLELDGETIGEIGITCAQAAHLGVPLVFISGDRAAIAEARRFVPNIEAVIVKERISVTRGDRWHAPTLTIAPAKARILIREGARRAMQRIGEIQLPPKPSFDPVNVD